MIDWRNAINGRHIVRFSYEGLERKKRVDEFLRIRLLGTLLSRLGSDQLELRRDLVTAQLAASH